MKRFVLWFLATLLTLALIIPMALYATVRSEAGSRVLLDWALSLSPVALIFSEARGNLLQGMVFSDFELLAQGLEVRASSLDIAWQPQMLWVGALNFQHVEIRDLAVTTQPQSDDSQSRWPSVNLPIRLSIDRLLVAGFKLNGTELFQRFEFSGELAGSSLNISSLSLERETEQLDLSGQLSLAGAYPLSLQMNWQYRFQEEDWAGAARLTGDLEQLQINHQLISPYQVESEIELSQELPESPDSLSVERLSFAATHRAIQLDLREWLGDTGLISDLNLEMSGQLNSVDFAVQTELELPWAGASQISAVGQYQPGLAVIQQMRLDSEKGQVVAAGFYDLESQLIDIREMSLANVQLLDGLSPMQAQLQVQINLAEDFSLEAQLLEASLEHGSLQFLAKGPVLYRAGRASTQGLSLVVGANEARIEGLLYPELELDWQLQGPELASVLMEFTDVVDASLEIQASGSLRGEYANPALSATLRGSNIELADLAIESLQVTIAPEGTKHNIAVEVPNLNYGGREIKDIVVDGSVEGQRFEIHTGLAYESLELTAQGGGAREEENWQFSLTQLDLNGPQPIGSWSLEQDWQVSQTAQGWFANRGCWRSREAGLCAEARISENTPASVDLELTDLPLNFLEYLIVSPVRVEGLLSGRLHAEGEATDIQLQANFRSDTGSFVVLGQERAPDPVSYRQLVINAGMAERLLDVNAGLILGESGRVSAGGQVDFSAEEPYLDAALNLDLDTLQWLEGVITQIDAAQGDLKLALNAQGPLLNPTISAVGALRDGGFIVPRAGIELSNLQLSAQTIADDRIEIEASAQSGDGQVELMGYIDSAALDQLAAQLSIRGDRFQLLDRPDLHLAVNPDLQISLSPELLDISGSLVIPEARARIRALPAGGIKPSEDEVIVGENAAATSPRLQTRMDLRVSLGAGVEFQGFGLTTGLVGDLDIEQNPGEPQRSFGSIELIEGEYSAYGRTLSVQRGRMIFQGEPDNPALDVDAEQIYPQYLVGIHLGGTAQEPTTTLYSNPVMSQSDVLAVLLTGHKLDTMSASEAPTLLDAATRLSIVGGASIAERIEDSFGLSEFGVRNDNLNGQSIVAGTYLLPRLYVEWAQGLFEASSSVQLEYRISSQLRLKARSGSSQSMDLIYEIETD